jgi:hypothetical protein
MGYNLINSSSVYTTIGSTAKTMPVGFLREADSSFVCRRKARGVAAAGPTIDFNTGSAEAVECRRATCRAAGRGEKVRAAKRRRLRLAEALPESLTAKLSTKAVPAVANMIGYIVRNRSCDFLTVSAVGIGPQNLEKTVGLHRAAGTVARVIVNRVGELASVVGPCGPAMPGVSTAVEVAGTNPLHSACATWLPPLAPKAAADFDNPFRDGLPWRRRGIHYRRLGFRRNNLRKDAAHKGLRSSCRRKNVIYMFI